MNSMIFKNSQDDIVFSEDSIPLGVTSVGVKLSGGVDSTIVTYMAAKYFKEFRPEITFHPIIFIAEDKAYNKIFGDRIVDLISSMLSYQFGESFYSAVRSSSSEEFVADQEKFMDWLYESGTISKHLSGLSAVPNLNEAPELYSRCKEDTAMISERISRNNPQYSKTWFRPLTNIDKKGIRELYEFCGVLDSLFPLTRSCSMLTIDFSVQCGWCWHCRERKWGFGSYE